ncbi:DUF924 family protein [Pelagibacterium xiamenense]|uniref:DUF924 family protein n=1 Tax=Pelagibacterium xiamenense TaxID=2901140 RepID=UPI001E36F653|nr:DUF924 family protein [Pelagibacterium xiamenense]MCD7058979.1 DUF924 domain-containing protein [Pelagibacterium xiamenense]
MQPKDVLDFWFEQYGPDDWFGGDRAFDRACHEALSEVHAKAVRAELWTWRETPEGRLAEIILLDQLSRQLYRGQPQAFASDTMAVSLAQEIVYRGLDTGFDAHQRLFAYMPFQHAESLVIQEESVRLFKSLDNEDLLKYALDHRDVIARFGRFPKRNAALGRVSTPEEEAYIAERSESVF